MKKFYDFLIPFFIMSEGLNRLGKKLCDAVDSRSIVIVKEIISESSRNPGVLDWKSEQVDCIIVFVRKLHNHDAIFLSFYSISSLMLDNPFFIVFFRVPLQFL